MAIKLIGSYAKKLGLPSYSSHSFAASVETEIADLSQAPQEVARLYHLLQEAVDREIRHPGFIPNGGRFKTEVTGNFLPNGSGNAGIENHEVHGKAWACSDKQRRLILQLIGEQGWDQNRVQERAYQRFQTGLRQLNRQQASALISELLDSASELSEGRQEGTPVTPWAGD